MRLITLNTWGGSVFAPLMDFVRKNAATTDAFCFQEVFHNTDGKTEARGAEDRTTFITRANLYMELQQALPGHAGHFSPAEEGKDFVGPVGYPLGFGLACFVKKERAMSNVRDVEIYEGGARTNLGSMRRNMQMVDVVAHGKTVTICNIHGLWVRTPSKTDMPARIQQSQKIRAAVDALQHPYILCGDFNLLPDTQSIAMLAEKARNLVVEYDITSTRTLLYDAKKTQFADYIFTSTGLEVRDFQVLPDVVSDHAALMAEFDL